MSSLSQLESSLSRHEGANPSALMLPDPDRLLAFADDLENSGDLGLSQIVRHVAEAMRQAVRVTEGLG